MILFNTCAGPEIGFGHLARSRALATALLELGVPCSIFGPDAKYKTNFDNNIFLFWHPTTHKYGEMTTNNSFFEFALRIGSQTLVIDHPRVDEHHQIRLLRNNFRWLQYDQSADTNIWANILVRANPAAKKINYKKLMKRKHSKVLLGPKYAALRQEFTTTKPLIKSSKIEKILVTFGGGNDRGAIQLTLQALSNSNRKIEFCVISSSSNPNALSILKKYSSSHFPNVQILVDPPNMAQIMSECQIAIMAGGTTTFEAASMNLPMILIAMNDSQAIQSKAWQTLGGAIYVGHIDKITESSLQDAFAVIHQDVSTEKHRFSNALKNFDALGATRLAAQMLELDSGQNKSNFGQISN